MSFLNPSSDSIPSQNLRNMTTLINSFSYGKLIVSFLLWSSSYTHAEMVDMTHVMNSSAKHWPIFRDFAMETAVKGRNPETGIWVEANEIALNEHTGTHIDAPVHFWETGIHVHEIKLENLVGPAVVLDIRTQCLTKRTYKLTVEDVQKFEQEHGRIPNGAIVFLNTGGAKDYWTPEAYFGTETPTNISTFVYPGFGEASVKWLMDNRDIKGIGADRVSFDASDTLTAVHIALLSSGRFGLENINNVDKIPITGATVFVMPIPLQDGSGAPARVIAYWHTSIPAYGSACSLSTLPAVTMALFLSLISLNV